LGEGRWDALWGVLGMLTGGALYAEVYPSLKTSVLTWIDLGKLTLPQVLHLPHWVVIAILAALFVTLFRFFKERQL